MRYKYSFLLYKPKQSTSQPASQFGRPAGEHGTDRTHGQTKTINQPASQPASLAGRPVNTAMAGRPGRMEAAGRTAARLPAGRPGTK